MTFFAESARKKKKTRKGSDFLKADAMIFKMKIHPGGAFFKTYVYSYCWFPLVVIPGAMASC